VAAACGRQNLGPDQDSVETSDGGALLTWHNYLFRFEGYKPVPDDLEVVFAVVPKLDLSALPTLPQYLPQDRLVANSERYILGPASLQEFQPGLPLSVVAFSMGAEGQVADVRTKAGQADLALFAYPTPQIAIQRVAEFQKLPGVVAKRTGPMVVALIGARDPDEAELILAGINFKGAVTLNERMPTARDNVGEMLISIFVLTGIIMALIIVAGIAVGLMRRWWSWSGREEEPMIRLHLSDR
jgi:hypothetical protein